MVFGVRAASTRANGNHSYFGNNNTKNGFISENHPAHQTNFPALAELQQS
jgi:hypothetical protein